MKTKRRNIASYITDRKSITVINVCVYTAIIMLILKNYVVAQYGYLGLAFYSPNVFELILNVCFCVLPCLFIRQSNDKASSFIIWYVYLTLIIPSVIIPFLMEAEAFRFVFINAVISCSFIATLFVINRKREVRLEGNPMPPQLFLNVFLLLFIALLLVTIINFGIPTRLPSLYDVYDLRSQARDIYKESSFMAYIIPWLANCIIPYLLVYAIATKKRFLFFCACVAIIYLFMSTGKKHFLLVFILLVATGKFLIRYRHNFGNLLLTALNLFLCCALLIDSLLPKAYIQDLVIRRSILVPGILAGKYFDFFSDSKNLYMLSQSFLSPFFSKPYELNPPYLIGAHYFNMENMSANTGFVSEGYSNFGIWGIMIYSLIFGVALRMLDNLTFSKQSTPVFLALSIPIAFAFSDSAMFTVLLTHGFLLLLVMAYFYPRKMFRTA